ncbi:MAG: exonuclease SbcCD subunit D [bacterium]
MRLFHTSDTHLGHQQFSRTDASGLNQREQDHAAAFQAVVDAAVAEKPDLFIHAGDLFDGVRPSNRALAQAMHGFWALSRAGIPVVVIAGNHEHPKLRDTGSPLSLFTDIPGVHVAYKGSPETFAFRVGGRALHVHAVPQMESAQALGQAITALPRGPPDLHVLAVHGAVTTVAVVHHGEFNELSIEPSWLEGFDYVALGHYHGLQEVLPTAWYCGAPERASIAEAAQEKGFLEVTLGAQAAVRFRPLPARPYVDLPAIDGTGRDGPDILAEARAAISAAPAGAVVRQRIRNVDARLRGGLDLRSLQEAGRHLLHLDLSRIEWQDTRHDVAGVQTIGPLASEFEAFVAKTPLAGVDRPTLLALARSVLEAP